MCKAMSIVDPVELARRLIRCPSVTPAEAGALDLLEETLRGLGFETHRLVFDEPGSTSSRKSSSATSTLPRDWLITPASVSPRSPVFTPNSVAPA